MLRWVSGGAEKETKGDLGGMAVVFNQEYKGKVV
jgi:hypothetical protein